MSALSSNSLKFKYESDEGESCIKITIQKPHSEIPEIQNLPNGTINIIQLGSSSVPRVKTRPLKHELNNKTQRPSNFKKISLNLPMKSDCNVKTQQIHHPVKQERVEKSNLIKHESVNEKSSLKIEKILTQNECDICGKELASPFAVKCHKRRSHPDPNVSRKRKGLKFSERYYKCDICFYTTAKTHNFKRHLERHEKNRLKHMDNAETVACPQCNQLCRNSHQLRSHTQTVHPKTSYECQVCGLSLKIKQSFVRHMRRFHTDKVNEVDLKRATVPNAEFKSASKKVKKSRKVKKVEMKFAIKEEDEEDDRIVFIDDPDEDPLS